MSERVLRACAMFGLPPEEAREAAREAVRAGREISARGGTITLLTGASGSGKTSALRSAVEQWRAEGRMVIEARPASRRAWRRACVELVGEGEGEEGVARAMRRLSQVGLGEARCFVRSAQELSEGQRERLWLGMALERAARTVGSVIVVDEFLARLDRVTARVTARCFAREVRQEGVSAVVATAHDDLEEALGADEVVRFGLDGGVRVTRGAGESAALEVEYGEAEWEECAGLLRFHYRGARPAMVARVMAARVEGEVVGALIVAMPTLNGVWRRLAWGDRYSSGDRRECARRLNAEVRRISRVVVDPRWRGVGIAKGLVRAYLDAPLTARTEAVAAMGAVCPFFERAGMRAHRAPAGHRDARLLDVFAHLGVREWETCDGARVLRAARERGLEAWLEWELERWVGDGRGRETCRGLGVEGLAREACRRVSAEQVAYTDG